MFNIKVPLIYKPLFDSSDWEFAYLRGGRYSGKSHSVARYIIKSMLEKNIRVLCAREFQNSIKTSSYALLKNIISSHKLNKYFKIKNDSIICTLTNSEVLFKGIKNNPDSIRSIEDVNLLFIEEAHNVSESSFNTVLPSIRGKDRKIIITWNPMRETDTIELMRKNIKDTDLDIFSSYKDCEGLLGPEFYSEYDRVLLQTPALLNHIFYGHYLPISAFNPFPFEYINSCYKSPFIFCAEKEKYAGIDTAYSNTETSDYTAIIIGDKSGNILFNTHFKTDDIIERNNRLLSYLQEYDVFQVNIDKTGDGHVLAQFLKENGQYVREYKYTKQMKLDHLNELIERMGKSELNINNCNELYEELLNYERNPQTDKLGAIAGKHDDLVSSLMLYVQAIK